MSERSAVSPSSTNNTTTSVVDFHRGNMLLRASGTYPSLLLTVIETIQNAIDGDANRIFVGINLQGSNRTINVADNGNGVDVFTFEKALGSVGQSIKTKGKLGRFGLGLISPLDKCKSFTLMSSPRTEGGTSTRWTFSREDIAAQHESVSIPRQTVRGLPQVHTAFKNHLNGEFNLQYRTMVSMKGVTEDKVIALMDLDELAGETLAKLGNAMRAKGVKVLAILIDEKGIIQRREITATEFSGEKLPVVVYEDKTYGDVTLSLYKAERRAGKRAGLVSVGETGSLDSISINDLARQATSSHWGAVTKNAFEALKSGFFEGTITSSGITMRPERTKFEFDESMRAMLMAIGLWFDEHGKQQLEDQQEASRETRYQDLGIKSQQRLQESFSTPAGELMLSVLRATVTFGRMGSGHVSPESGRPSKPEEIGSVRVGQGGAGVPRTPSNKPKSSKPADPDRERGRDRPGDVPIGTTGPRGNNRRLVRGDSQGLWYEHVALVANSHLWEFDLELGVLTFNIKHPIWTRLDETRGKHLKSNANQIMHLQEWLTLQVLNLLVQFTDKQDFEDHRGIIDKQLKLYVDMFIAPSTR